MNNLKHIVAYYPDYDTAVYFGNDWLNTAGGRLDLVEDISDAFVFETDEALQSNTLHYMILGNGEYEMIFTEMPDIEELMVI